MNKKLALNFRKYNDSEIDEIAFHICNQMTGSEHFPDFQTLLPPISETLKQFQHYRRESFAGDTNMILVKNDFKEKLIYLLRDLGEMVDKKANGDELMIVRSGFDIARPPQKAKLEKPNYFQVLPGKLNGQIILQAQRVKGAKAYIYQYTRGPLDDNNQWKIISSTKRKIVISDLPLGVQFFFQMAAVGARNQIVYSDVIPRYIA
jgi:hypothetical protein